MHRSHQLQKSPKLHSLSIPFLRLQAVFHLQIVHCLPQLPHFQTSVLVRVILFEYASEVGQFVLGHELALEFGLEGRWRAFGEPGSHGVDLGGAGLGDEEMEELVECEFTIAASSKFANFCLRFRPNSPFKGRHYVYLAFTTGPHCASALLPHMVKPLFVPLHIHWSVLVLFLGAKYHIYSLIH